MGMDTNAKRGAARISRGRPPPAHDDVAADAGREAGAAAQFERAGERDGRRGKGARQLGDTRIYTESRHVCLWGQHPGGARAWEVRHEHSGAVCG